jgi:hypothetical protein
MGRELHSCAPRSFREIRRDFVDGIGGRTIRCVENEDDMEKMEEEAHAEWRDKNIIARFATALGYVLISHTEELCYLIIVRCLFLFRTPLCVCCRCSTKRTRRQLSVFHCR